MREARLGDARGVTEMAVMRRLPPGTGSSRDHQEPGGRKGPLEPQGLGSATAGFWAAAYPDGRNTFGFSLPVVDFIRASIENGRSTIK